MMHYGKAIRLTKNLDCRAPLHQGTPISFKNRISLSTNNPLICYVDVEDLLYCVIPNEYVITLQMALFEKVTTFYEVTQLNPKVKYL